ILQSLAWDARRYLNIYTWNLQPAGLLGRVTLFPWESGNNTYRDGVLIHYQWFGDGMGAQGTGRTATHEVGHYMGLLHVFQGGCGPAAAPDCYTNDDLICDTEPASGPASPNLDSCPTGLNSCLPPDGTSARDPVRNYMNYVTDTCYNNFTPEQAKRIR